jgi:hypothetical protein
MITRTTVSEKILAYLDGNVSLAILVDWAENCFVTGSFAPVEDIPLLTDIVMYLAGGDTDYFPLTWDVIQEFMAQLGTPIRVVAVFA